MIAQNVSVSDNLIALGKALDSSSSSYKNLHDKSTKQGIIDISEVSSVALQSFLNRDLPQHYAPIIELVNDYLMQDLSRTDLTIMEVMTCDEAERRTRTLHGLLMEAGAL